MLYDNDALYVGVRLLDRQAGQIGRRLSRRDDEPDADAVQVYLDPRRDGRSGAMFEVTAAAVQRDALIFNDASLDFSWDAVWDSAMRVDERGWTAEIRIPFSQLRFPSEGASAWGLNVARYIRRKNEPIGSCSCPSHSTQRLRTALTLVIAQPEQQRSRFAFHVINIGAGHSVPTGSNRRAVCLVADVLDRQRRIVTTKEWMFAPSYGNRPDDRAFLDADQQRPDAIAAAQADAQGPHESTIRAGEERMLSWNPALNAGRYTVRARLIYDLNRYNDRRLTSDQTELHRATLSVGIGASAMR